MNGHIFACGDCGATSPTYLNQAVVVAIRRGHVCDKTCPACNFRRTRPGLRGLCNACYADLDIRIDYATKFWSADDMLDTWDELRREGYSVRQAAERMGVTFAALDMAIYRGSRRGDPRARRGGSKVRAA